MILTEEKTYIINVTEVDTDAELGLNKKDIMIKYTNLELLHAVLASTMPYGRLSARYRGKRKAELQSRIAMVESVLETRGDQLAKAEQIMYLDTAERSAICHYLGIIYTRLIAQKLYGIDCMVPLNLIEQPGEKKFVKYNGAYRQDLIGYGSRTHGASGSRSAGARTARRPLETDAGRRRRSRRSMKIRWRRVRRA